jgi:hypothetical protein
VSWLEAALTPLEQFRQLPQDTRMRAFRIVDYDTKQWVWYEPRAAQLVLREAMRTHNRIIVPKARRLGASTEVEAFLFDALLMADNPLPLASMAHVDRAARNIGGMLRGMYEGLPAEIRPQSSKMNEYELVLKESGAKQTVYMAGGRGGTRSFAAGMAHLSEFDFYPDQAETLAEVDATVGDGLLIVESTVNQPGSKFHDLVKGAPENGWHVCFLPWTLHPAYADKVTRDFAPTAAELVLMEEHGLTLPQVAWRRRQMATLGKAKFRREYPLTVEEAFATQSKRFFTVDCMEHVEVKEVRATDQDRLRVLEDWEDGSDYAIGVDVSAGVGSDSSVITVVDASTRSLAAQWVCSKTTPSRLAEHILRLGRAYEWPVLVIESNVYGRRVIEDVARHGYPRRRMWTDDNGKPWRTHGGNRAGLFELVRSTMEEGFLGEFTKELYEQVVSIGWNAKKNRPDHPQGKHDDMVISLALALVAAQEMPLRLPEERSRVTMEDLIRKNRVREAKRAHPFTVRGDRRRPM